MESSLPDNLNAWLQRLEQQHPVAIDMGLERVAAVAQTLGITSPTQHRATVITVAGTNGKGSTLAAIEAILQSSRRSADNSRPSYGKYTSPHLRRFNERIVINGELATDASICNAFTQIEQARCATPAAPSLTYFEFSTLAALYLFQQAALDFWLLEVGLGGRLDAVNIIDPDIAIITAIGMDHQDYLGDTLDEIAAEKAGIVRPGIPVLVADPHPPPGLLQGIASRQGDISRISDVELDIWQDRKPQLHHAAWWSAERALALLEGVSSNPLSNTRLSESKLVALAGNVTLDGRLQQCVWQGRHIVLDVSHNTESTTRLRDWLAENNKGDSAIFGLMGVMADKPFEAMQMTLSSVIDRWSFCDLPVQRAISAQGLADCWRRLSAKITNTNRAGFADSNHSAQVFDNMKTALNSLVQSSDAGDKIVIFGSFHTVAAALEVLDNCATT